MEAVLVLNADLGPLHRVSLKHAIRMLCRQVAEVHEAEPDRLIGVYPVPRVVRLVHYVVTRWRYSGGPAWSRAGVLARDGHRCGYCGGAATPSTTSLPAFARREEHLAQHRGRLWRLQPAQGRPHPRRGGHASADQAGGPDVGHARPALRGPYWAAPSRVLCYVAERNLSRYG